MNAKDIIECNACHVCDGELYEGWRVGCDDLIFRAGAEEAVKVKEEEMILKAIEAFKFATSGYFIIGGTDYSGNRLNEFIEKLNSKKYETDNGRSGI